MRRASPTGTKPSLKGAPFTQAFEDRKPCGTSIPFMVFLGLVKKCKQWQQKSQNDAKSDNNKTKKTRPTRDFPENNKTVEISPLMGRPRGPKYPSRWHLSSASSAPLKELQMSDSGRSEQSSSGGQRKEMRWKKKRKES